MSFYCSSESAARCSLHPPHYATARFRCLLSSFVLCIILHVVFVDIGSLCNTTEEQMHCERFVNVAYLNRRKF